MLEAVWREVSSFYRVDRTRIGCIGKQLWDRNEQRLVGLGMFYFLLTQTIFPGEGIHAAAMGIFSRNGTVFTAGTTDWA